MNVCSECKRSEKHIVLLETPLYARFQGDYVGFETGTDDKHICFTCFITLHFVKDWAKREGLKNV
jgi:hypothetical protein